MATSTQLQPPALVTFTNFNSFKLTRDNYPLWLPQIVPHLKGGNLFGYVDGTYPCPSPTITSTKDGVTTTSPNPACLHWTMQDQLILGAINSALSKKTLSHVTRCRTSKEAWVTLETLFASQAKARSMQVHFQLATLKKGNSSIADYFSKFQALVDALTASGHSPNEFESVSFLLAGLGPDYDPFVTSVTTRVEPLSIDEIYGHLLSHELRLEQHTTTLDLSVAGANFAAHGHSYRGNRGGRGFPSGHSSSGRGYHFGQSSSGRSSRGRGRGNSSSSGRGSSSSNSHRPVCQVCNRTGHVALDCYNRFNESYSREPSSQPQAYLSAPSAGTDLN